MPSPRNQPKVTAERWNGDIAPLQCIGKGASSLVFAIDAHRVAKIPLGTARSQEDVEVERQIYRKFRDIRKKSEDSDYRHILACFEVENPRGIVLERCKETVRSRLQSGVSVEEAVRLKWARQAARGLSFVHGCRVIQGDVGCHNMLLDARDNLKLADFAGASINGSDASVNYEVRSRLPGLNQPTKGSDLFALGSVFHELATGMKPYANIESPRAIQSLYKQKRFPADAGRIPVLGPVILRCWQQRYDSAWEVVRALKGVESETKVEELVDLPLGDLVFTESVLSPRRISIGDSLERTVSSASSQGQSSSYTYVHPPPQRRRRHQQDSGGQSTGGKGRETRRPSHSEEHTWLNRFFPWTHHQSQKRYEKTQYCC